MNELSLWCFQEENQEVIKKEAALIAAAVDSNLRLEEYVCLPELGGRIILRFTHSLAPLSLSEAEKLELGLRKEAQSRFSVVLLMSTFGLSSLEQTSIIERLLTFDNLVSNEELETYHNFYQEELREDVEKLKEHLGLEKDALIWEIEVSQKTDVRPVIRIVTRENNRQGVLLVGSQIVAIEYLPKDDSYYLLLKALYWAEKNNKSFIRLFLDDSLVL